MMSNLKRKEKTEKKLGKRKMIILTKRRKSRKKSPFLAITTLNRSPQPDSGNT